MIKYNQPWILTCSILSVPGLMANKSYPSKDGEDYKKRQKHAGLLIYIIKSSQLPGHGERRCLQLQQSAFLTPSKVFVSEDNCKLKGLTLSVFNTCHTFVVGSWSNVCFSASVGGFN
jgi:hypothetical protein